MFRNIFGNFYQKENTIENFFELKIEARLLNNFYFEFISIACDNMYNLEMLIWKFKHKLTLCL